MPIYEYLCPDCSARFETYVRAWGDAVTCPKCDGASVERQLSTFAMSSGGGAKAETAPVMAGGGGGCCGGGCGCR